MCESPVRCNSPWTIKKVRSLERQRGGTFKTIFLSNVHVLGSSGPVHVTPPPTHTHKSVQIQPAEGSLVGLQGGMMGKSGNTLSFAHTPVCMRAAQVAAPSSKGTFSLSADIICVRKQMHDG